MKLMKSTMPEYGETSHGPWVLMACCLLGEDCCSHRASVEEIADALVERPHLMTELEGIFIRKMEAKHGGR